MLQLIPKNVSPSEFGFNCDWRLFLSFCVNTCSTFVSAPAIGCSVATLNLSLPLSRCVDDMGEDFDTTVCTSGLGSTFTVCSDELWRLSLTTLEWTKIEVPSGGVRPSARARHTMTSVGLDLWVFGGYTHSGEGDSYTTRVVLLRIHWCCPESESEPLSSLRQEELSVFLGSVSLIVSPCVWVCVRFLTFLFHMQTSPSPTSPTSCGASPRRHVCGNESTLRPTNLTLASEPITP